MTPPPVTVLVVEDSLTVQQLLIEAINSEPRLRVAGAVKSGEEALAFVANQKPDVILMDVHLPGMNGFETTRRIMETNAVPIVICSAVENPTDVATMFQAMEVGALTILGKPYGPAHPEFEPLTKQLVETLKVMAEVKVVRRWNRNRATAQAPHAAESHVVRPRGSGAKLVGIGTSTGGPPVLRTIFAALPADFPVPILVVQHIAPGFLRGLVEWLSDASALPIHVGVHGERALPGHVYFAPDGFHMGVGARGQIVLSDREVGDTLCPSVSRLFSSFVDVCGGDCVAVLLTGMGRDGAHELAALKHCGATTIAQDKATSVVHGMPGAAIQIDAAHYVLGAHEIAPALRRLVTSP